MDRAHQVAMDDLAGKLIAGALVQQSIVLDCTPGGGKTGSATLLANRFLDAALIDRVLWVVPRLSLAEQVCSAFATGYASRQGRQLDVVSGQDIVDDPQLPNMPLNVGWVTTYQSIATAGNWQRFLAILKEHRPLVIFDEIQFLSEEEDLGWARKVARIHDAATYRLLMSGTLWRTNNRRIFGIRYEKGEDGKYYPVWDIRYDYRQAVSERAILPTEWHTRSGKVEYIYGGTTKIHDLLEDDQDEESRKVRAFLANEAAVNGLLDNMVEHWRDWKRRRSYQSRMLVMAQDIREARRIKKYLECKHQLPCVLATSSETDHARAIRRFRERSEGQCLVTVAMAYVGFDCPDLSHLAYLSVARAPSWLLQSFARVSRFDSRAPIDYDYQHAFVFSSDDERLRRFFDWLRSQQDMGIRLRLGGNGTQGKKEPLMPDDFEPVTATPGGIAIESIHRRIDPATQAQLESFVQRCPAAADVPLSKLYEVLTAANVHLPSLATKGY